MDNVGHREDGRQRQDSYKALHTQWMMPQRQMKDHHSMNLLALMSERDNAIMERDHALAEKKAAMAERDMAFAQRDSAMAERNAAIVERDNALAALELARTNGFNMNNGNGFNPGSLNGAKNFHHHDQQPHAQSLPLQLADAPYDHAREMHISDAYPISTAPVSAAGKAKKPKKNSSQGSPLKRPSGVLRKTKKAAGDWRDVGFRFAQDKNPPVPSGAPPPVLLPPSLRPWPIESRPRLPSPPRHAAIPRVPAGEFLHWSPPLPPPPGFLRGGSLGSGGAGRALRVSGPCSSFGRRCGPPVPIGCGSAPRRISEPEIATAMGAKVEVEGYKPAHCAMGDLHASANGWRFPYEEETSNGFVTAEAAGYSEYDKEMFRRTMLAHEAVFRQQVYELHRVYRVQRDLMKQHQSREMHACSTLEDASQRNSPSQIPPHGANMIGTAALNNEKSHSSKFPREGSVQSSPNGFPSSDATLPTKQGRFDLELGAEHYVEDDHASDSKPIDFLGVSPDTKHPNDAGVALARAQGLGMFGHNSATSLPPSTGNLVGHHVADLNKPIPGPYMARTNGAVSGGPSYTLENSWQQSPWRSSATNCSFNKEYSKDKRINEATSSNFFDASSRIKQEAKPLIDKGKRASSTSFLAPRCSGMDPQKMFSAADRGSASSNKFIYQCPNSSSGWFSGSPLEASAINNLPGHDHLRYPSSTLGTPFTSMHTDQPSAASRVGSCIVDPRSYNISADVQSFPSFNGSSTVNSYACFSAANQSIGTLSCNLKKINNSDGSYSGIPLDSLSASRPWHQVTVSSDLEQNNKLMFGHPTRHCHEDPDSANGKVRKNFNLNEALSDGQEDILVEQDVGCSSSLQHVKVEGSVSGISWLSKKASCADCTGLEEPRKVFEHSYGTTVLMNINEDITGAAVALCNLPDSASTSVGCGTKKDKPCDNITAKTQESAECLPLSRQKPMPGDGQAAEGITNKAGAAAWNFIDLNEDAPNEDNSESSVVSSDCHVTSLQNNHAKPKFLIDLEVPACEDDDTATAAAESILALSMDVPATAEIPDDMLQWFAELAVSSIGDHAGKGEVQGRANNSSDDDLDSFESLTLKLEDVKTVEFCSRPLPPATTDDEQTVSLVDLLSKPKRGQQRKRRQKRDFQKDILPSISSLCRPEIIEDIQLLEGLVQTTGGSWESSLTRRRRTRCNKRSKKRVLDAVEEEAQISVEEEVQVSPPAKPDDEGVEADSNIGMIGWGRTTRRCRRTRCPSAITVAAAS